MTETADAATSASPAPCTINHPKQNGQRWVTFNKIQRLRRQNNPKRRKASDARAAKIGPEALHQAWTSANERRTASINAIVQRNLGGLIELPFCYGEGGDVLLAVEA